jgi:hypothetical protein
MRSLACGTRKSMFHVINLNDIITWPCDVPESHGCASVVVVVVVVDASSQAFVSSL